MKNRMVGGRWSSLVKITQLTPRNEQGNGAIHAENEIKNTKWAGSDLNQRPPPCQGKLISNDISSTDRLVSVGESYIGCSKSTSPDFWSSFQSYLSKNNNYLGVRDRLNYAMKYAYILDTGDARHLLELSHEKRIHIMKSLSALAKYSGRYHKWQQIRQSFQLKWSNSDSLKAFNLIFNKENDLDHMLSWLRDTCSMLSWQYSDVLMFNTLTGLRPSEAYISIRLIHDSLENYLNNDTGILEHFRFPHFIRRTKKAYISIVNDRILGTARSANKDVSYNQLKLQFKRRGIDDIHMLFCRKIFATYLRIQGVEQEIIDLLQGRIPHNVFVRHYFRPSFVKENEKVTTSLEKLYKKITSN
jgi:hypothetical protein